MSKYDDKYDEKVSSRLLCKLFDSWTKNLFTRLSICANLNQINGELKKDNFDKEGHKISSCQIVFATQ